MPFSYNSLGKPDLARPDFGDQIRHGKESGHDWAEDVLKAVQLLEPYMPKKSVHHNGLQLEAKGHVDDYSGEIHITVRTVRLVI